VGADSTFFWGSTLYHLQDLPCCFVIVVSLLCSSEQRLLYCCFFPFILRQQEVGADSTFFWGSTLYHLQDLPFKLDAMPCNYGGFREAIKSLKVQCHCTALYRTVQ